MLGAGGFEMGAFGEPGPGGVLPGVHGLATVAEVPGIVAGPVAEAVVEVPLPVDAVPVPVEAVPAPGEVVVPVVLVVPGVVLEVLAVPVLVPLLDGVQGATVLVVPELLVVVP